MTQRLAEVHFPQREKCTTHLETDRQAQATLAALIARDAPGTRTYRVRWSRGETQVLELGVGPPVLLLHGGLSSAIEWVRILSTLARNRRVLAVDRPGHGLADPFDYAGVDLLEHARTFLRDIGALWSVAFALQAPDRVSRLILAGAPAGTTRTCPIQLRLLGLPVIGQPLGRLLMSRSTRGRCRTFWGEILVTHPERLDDALLDAILASQRRNIESHLSLLRCVLDACGLRRHLILGDRWRALTVSTLFLWGDRDAFAPASEGETIAAQNPNLRLVRIPGAGHLPWIDNPARVVAEIERFLG
jgi:pimeloyl-ACP methyl ester carboxylesterase